MNFVGRYLNQLQASKPVLLTGDLNVAHLDSDIYNYFAPHIKKTPGCTVEERQSMTTMLEEVCYICTIYMYYAYEDIQSICPFFYAYSGANLIGYPQTHRTYIL